MLDNVGGGGGGDSVEGIYDATHHYMSSYLLLFFDVDWLP